MARDFDRQVAEFQVRVAVLNGYPAPGILVTKVAGQVCPGIGAVQPSANLCNRCAAMARRCGHRETPARVRLRAASAAGEPTDIAPPPLAWLAALFIARVGAAILGREGDRHQRCAAARPVLSGIKPASAQDTAGISPPSRSRPAPSPPLPEERAARVGAASCRDRQPGGGFQHRLSGSPGRPSRHRCSGQ